MNDISNQPNEEESHRPDYWGVALKHKRFIWRIVAAFFFLSIIVSLLLPKMFASTTKILPPQQTNPFSLSIASQLPAGLRGLSSGFLGIRSTSNLWVGILKSQNISDSIIDKFNLKKLYVKKRIEDTREELSKRVSIVKSRKDSIISITVKDRIPERAAQMANAFVEELDRINMNIIMSSGKRARIFLEKRIKNVKEELVKSEDALKAFQEKNKAVKLDAQSKAVFETIGKIKGNLISKEVELQTLLSYATPTNPQVEILNTRINELKKKLRELEEGEKGGINPRQKNIFIPIAIMPDIGLKYARLLRNLKIQETLYELLTQQYEIARIQEAKDSPTIQILDRAKVPEKKVSPKRTLIVLLSTLVSFFAGITGAFILEYLDEQGTKIPRPIKILDS